MERLFAEGKAQHGLSRARSCGLEAMLGSHTDDRGAESQTIKPVCAEAPTDREFRVPQTGIRKAHKGVRPRF